MSPARRSRREAAAGDGPPFGEKTVEVVLRPGRSGGAELWGACLVGCIDSFQEKVVGVAEKRLQAWPRGWKWRFGLALYLAFK